MIKEVVSAAAHNKLPWWARTGVVLAAGAALMALSGCSKGEGDGAAAKPGAQSQEAKPSTSGSALPRNPGVKITFDDLGVAPHSVNVYGGVGPEYAGREVATYLPGDEKIATCKLVGRAITDHVLNKSSTDWVRLDVSNGPQFASALYIEEPKMVLDQLPPCAATAL